jgi:response regulator RpfG family c-di-GMP phosphodiesterase
MKVNGFLRKANVLAVDDQRANLVALDAVLGTEYNLIPANSGYEAISVLEERQDIDVVLMDVQMPGMDGFETATKIRTMDGCGDIPVVFITAVYNEDPFVKQGYKVGAVDYFSKPFDPEILKVKVGIYASFRQRSDILRERERQIRASEELRQVGRELSAMLGTLQVGVIVTDVEGKIQQVNEEASMICESVKEFEGRFLDTALNEVIEMRCPDGTVKTLLCTASPLRELDGRTIGAALVVQDLTERRKIEIDLEQRIAKLRHPDMERVAG